MKGDVSWTHGDGYVGTTSGGKRFSIYDESYPSPMEMVWHGHAACSMIDVVGGLQDRVENLEDLTVAIEAERAPESPKVFTSVNMRYIVRGDVPEKLVRRIIENSHEKLCSVGIMITRAGATLDWSLEMNP